MLDIAMRLARSMVAGWTLVAAAGVAPAQDRGGLEPLPAMVAEGFQLCWQASMNPVPIRVAAGLMGWRFDPAEDFGPFVQMLFGTKDYEGFGEALLVVTAERFPTHRIGYCQFQMEVQDSMVADLELVRSLENLRGPIETTPSGVFGMFEEDVDAPTVFVSAYQTDDDLVTITVTRVTAAAPQSPNVPCFGTKCRITPLNRRRDGPKS